MIAFIDAYHGQFRVDLICCTPWAAVAGFSPHVAIGPPKPGRPRTGRSATRCEPPRGAQRGKPVFTTIADPSAATPADLGDRSFTQPVVGDEHHLRADLGRVCLPHVCHRRAATKSIVGWAVAATMRTEHLPLQPFKHAVWQADSDLSELAHHPDHGSPPLPATRQPPPRRYRFPKTAVGALTVPPATSVGLSPDCCHSCLPTRPISGRPSSSGRC
jgi:hypothetical protein